MGHKSDTHALECEGKLSGILKLSGTFFKTTSNSPRSQFYDPLKFLSIFPCRFHVFGKLHMRHPKKTYFDHRNWYTGRFLVF